MGLIFGKPLHLEEGMAPVMGCTLSERLLGGEQGAATLFALSEGTGISPEIYLFPKAFLGLYGRLEILAETNAHPLEPGQMRLYGPQTQIGVQSHGPALYLEISPERNIEMNPIIEPGKCFALKDLLPIQEGRIANMDVFHNENMKFCLMSFGEGEGLSPHAAPGEAIVFALEGEAEIGYEGKKFSLKEGEQFAFAKGGIHSIKALRPFKMALLLVLE